jgi:hypothetical protein
MLYAYINILRFQPYVTQAYLGVYEGRIRAFKLLTDKVEKQIQK